MSNQVKFISKHSNLRLVLRPGLPGNHLTGQLPVPAIYIRFQDGVAVLSDEELITKMLAHSGFGRDFIKVEENDMDPYNKTRKEAEPRHLVAEMDHGYVGKTDASPMKGKPLSPELELIATARAKELAKEILMEMAQQQQAAKAPEQPAEAVSTPPAPQPVQKATKKPKNNKKIAKKVEVAPPAPKVAETTNTENNDEKFAEPIEAGQ